MNKLDGTAGKQSLLLRVLRDKRGVSALEYGLYASLIALAAIQAFSGLGFEVSDSLDNSTDKLAEQTARMNGDTTNRNANGDPNTVDPTSPDEVAPAEAMAPMDPALFEPVPTNPDEPPVAAAKAAP